MVVNPYVAARLFLLPFFDVPLVALGVFVAFFVCDQCRYFAGLIARTAFLSLGAASFALSAAANSVSMSARHWFSPVASNSRIEGMREKTHIKKAIINVGRELMMDFADG